METSILERAGSARLLRGGTRREVQFESSKSLLAARLASISVKAVDCRTITVFASRLLEVRGHLDRVSERRRAGS